MQGTYVFAPGGELLGRLNSLNPEKIAEMLEGALAKWDALPDEAKRFHGAIEPRHRWEHSYPEGGLVLVRVARDLTDDFDPAAEPIRPANQDQVWFRADEARGWLADDPVVGAIHTVPDALAQRIARFHLVDSVRGQTLPYAEEEVDVQLHTEVVAVDGGRVALRIHGTSSARATGPWLLGESYWKPVTDWPRALRTSIYGHAEFDRDIGMFRSFDVVAIGYRIGRTGFNGRSRQDNDSPRPIGFTFHLAPRQLRVAPTFINVYNADWVVHPGE